MVVLHQITTLSDGEAEDDVPCAVYDSDDDSEPGGEKLGHVASCSLRRKSLLQGHVAINVVPECDVKWMTRLVSRNCSCKLGSRKKKKDVSSTGGKRSCFHWFRDPIMFEKVMNQRRGFRKLAKLDQDQMDRAFFDSKAHRFIINI
jgi:hypothetical protein